MKKSIVPILLTSLLVAASSCNDDFLDRFPETSIGKENFFNSEEDLSLYIYNLYDFPGFDLYIGDLATDNAATTGNTEIKTIMTTEANSATITGGWDWERLRTINFFLENFRKADISPEMLDHFEGLARFFRARFYMDKVKRYSDVPWYDQVLESDDTDLLFKGRDSRDFVVQKIFEDYQFAAGHVLESQPAGAVNKWVVKAFMARHALYEGTFRKYHPELNLQGSANTYLNIAKNAAKDIMDSGLYSIYSTGDPQSDYHQLFENVDLAGNPEILLANISITNLKSSGYWEYMFGNYEVSPSRDLLHAYLMDDGSYFSSQPGGDEMLFVEEFENRDPRCYQTYAYPGWELIGINTYSQGVLNYVQQLQKNFTGYHQIKGFVNATDEDYLGQFDIPVLRYAEVLLTYAEAKAELGELGQADLDATVNLLRDRAGMPHLSMNPPVDPVQQARYPKVSDATLLEIRRERRVELALEGFRMDDLMRWGAGKLIEQEPEGLYFPSLGKYDLTGDGVEDIFLIPASESIPIDKEVNSLGVTLVYYRAGIQGEDAGVYLENGDSGTVQTDADRGVFEEPKHYYRPIPATHVTINPNLTQLFGWD